MLILFAVQISSEGESTLERGKISAQLKIVFDYFVYGVEILSSCQLPGLVNLKPAGIESDRRIHIWMDALPEWFQPGVTLALPSSTQWYVARRKDKNGNPSVVIWLLAERYYYFQYCDRTEFIIDIHGTEIWAKWPEDLTLEDTATYLLGPILGFVLRLHRTVCLHASAIAIDDRVVVLVGDAGAGKSTTAAAFAERGYPILSDDVAPLLERGDSYLVQPAYPRIRLWNSSVEALYGKADALPRLVPTHPTWDKRYLDLGQPNYRFQSEPLPLAAMYYLNARSEDPTCPQIEPLSPRDRCVYLIANTYGNNLLQKHLRAHEFEFVSRLSERVPMSKITPHRDLRRLPKLIDAIIEDAGKLVGT